MISFLLDEPGRGKQLSLKLSCTGKIQNQAYVILKSIITVFDKKWWIHAKCGEPCGGKAKQRPKRIDQSIWRSSLTKYLVACWSLMGLVSTGTGAAVHSRVERTSNRQEAFLQALIFLDDVSCGEPVLY
jgi:hypothetical protein